VDDLWTMDELWTKWMRCGRFVDDGRVVDEMDELWTKWMSVDDLDDG
jgi:hypothetical protein